MKRRDRAGFGIPPSVAFIAVTLVALAVLPAWAGLRVNQVEDDILATLEPARDRAVDLGALHSRQMSRFQEYMLTGRAAARTQYERLVAEEAVIVDDLRDLLAPTDLRIRALVLPVIDAATAWQLGHVAALSGAAGPVDFLPQISADRSRYYDLVAADQQLLTALNGEVLAARGRMEQARRLQAWLTVALVLLALAGTLAVAGLARRLQALVAESRERRDDAVRTRRAIDAIFAATADGVLSVDLDAQVERINPAAERLTGFSDAAARGRGVHDVLHGVSQPHADGICPIAQAVLDGVERVGVEGEVTVRGSETTTPVLWSVRPLLDGRERRGGVVTLADLTEIKEAEARLRRAIQAREETLAIVSHDLRSPLGSVIAGTELLLDVPLDEEGRRKHLLGIEAAAERMNRLIEDLLDVSRIDAGTFSVRRTPTEVRQVLEEARRAAEGEARERGIELVVESPTETGPASVDPNRTQQLLQNLVTNALRHTERGGRVTLGAEMRGGNLELRVADTGSGIVPEHLAHLFDRFWRAEQGDASGAGLGLAIVKGITDAHGGEVVVESRVGEGTTFRVRLPAGVSPGEPSTPGGR